MIEIEDNYTPLNDSEQDYMNEKQLLFFKKILENKLDKLKEEEELYLPKPRDNNIKDEMDVSSEEYEIAMSLRMHGKILKLIATVEGALSLIDQKKYGYCIVTNKRIGINRLLSKPTAKLCIEEQE
jgi:DnaK suppressor protein